MWTGARHGAPGASTAVWPSVGGRRRQRCAELVPRRLHAVACGVRSSVDLPPQSGGRQVPAAGKAVHVITDHKKNAAWAADPTLRGLGCASQALCAPWLSAAPRTRDSFAPLGRPRGQASKVFGIAPRYRTTTARRPDPCWRAAATTATSTCPGESHEYSF